VKKVSDQNQLKLREAECIQMSRIRWRRN